MMKRVLKKEKSRLDWMRNGLKKIGNNETFKKFADKAIDAVIEYLKDLGKR